MFFIGDIINKSKESLKGKYFKYFIMIIIVFLITQTTKILIDENSNKVLYSIISLLIVSITSTYTYTVDLNIARDNETIFPNVTNLLPKILKFLVMIGLQGMLLTLIGVSHSLILLIVLSIISIFFTIVFSQYLYIVVDNDNVGIIDAFVESSKLMKGNILNYLSLIIYFIPYILLSVVTLGIYLFWAIPKIRVATANFYLYLKENKIDNKKEAF